MESMENDFDILAKIGEFTYIFISIHKLQNMFLCWPLNNQPKKLKRGVTSELWMFMSGLSVTCGFPNWLL